MTHFSWKTRSLGLAMLLASASSTALAAANPVVLRLSDGNNAGPIGDNNGPGAEQATVTSLVVNGTRYLVTVWMSSQVAEDDRPYQCKCTSIAMDPLSGPTIAANAVQLTDNNGNRPCNHPKIATNGQDILWAYGTNDPDQNNVQAYVQGIDHMCNTVTDRLRISNNNGNDGAPDISFSQTTPEGMSYWVAGYLENNERSRAVGLTTTGVGRGMTITETFDNVVVDPANIGRPTIGRFTADRTLFCSANGNERPPELGVRCAMLNSMTGESYWSELIAASDPLAEPKIYYNQPQIAVGENGRMYVQLEQTNGGGRDNGDARTGRGSTRTHVYTLLPGDDGARIQGMLSDVGLHQVHATLCTGGYGADNSLHAAVFDASITGTGLAAAQLAKFDLAARTLTPVGNPRSLGAYNGDSGYLANLYGNNPNTQGRDFMRCVGDVPNPGFGVDNGHQPDVASYFVFAYAGKVMDEEKNSLFVSFLPAHVPVTAPTVQQTLDVKVDGDGTGTVSSSPLGIEGCASAVGCQGMFDEGTVVTLVATPAEGSTFVAWSGACAGGAECTVRVDRPQAVTATFTRVGSPLPAIVGLTVEIAGGGTGVVTSAPEGVDCRTGRCTANFDRGVSVIISALPDVGSNFTGWTGACMGTAPCTVTMNVARSLSAHFSLDGTAVVPPVGPGPGTSAPGEDPGPGPQATGADAGTGDPGTPTDETPGGNKSLGSNPACSVALNGGPVPAWALVVAFAGLGLRRSRRARAATAKTNVQTRE